MGMPALFAAREAPDLKGAFDGSLAPGVPFVRGAWTAPLVFGTPFAGLGLQQLAIGHTEIRPGHQRGRAGGGSGPAGAGIAPAGCRSPPVGRGLHGSRRGVHRHRGSARAGHLFHLDVVGGSGSGAAVAGLPAGTACSPWPEAPCFRCWPRCPSRSTWESPSPIAEDAWPIANRHFLGALLLAVAGLASGWLFSRRPQRGDGDEALVWTALAWGVVWWLVGGVMEIVQQLPDSSQLSALLGFVVGSFAAGALAARPAAVAPTRVRGTPDPADPGVHAGGVAGLPVASPGRVGMGRLASGGRVALPVPAPAGGLVPAAVGGTARRRVLDRGGTGGCRGLLAGRPGR